MLSPAFADMDASTFKKLPNSTNAVESYNWLGIGATPDVLSVALMTTYKLDMAAALQYLPVTKSQRVCLLHPKLAESEQLLKAMPGQSVGGIKLTMHRVKKSDFGELFEITPDAMATILFIIIIYYTGMRLFNHYTAKKM